MKKLILIFALLLTSCGSSNDTVSQPCTTASCFMFVNSLDATKTGGMTIGMYNLWISAKPFPVCDQDLDNVCNSSLYDCENPTFTIAYGPTECTP